VSRGENSPGADQAPTETPALAILRRIFGYPAFRGQQAAVIEHLIAGGDALVLMPTGGGKSLCFRFRLSCAAGSASSFHR